MVLMGGKLPSFARPVNNTTISRDRELGVDRDRPTARRMGEVQRQASLIQQIDHCFAREATAKNVTAWLPLSL
jgi:hypothetical protein